LTTVNDRLVPVTHRTHAFLPGVDRMNVRYCLALTLASLLLYAAAHA
jgi:hypothetical protein